jgi:hypothetical protein
MVDLIVDATALGKALLETLTIDVTTANVTKLRRDTNRQALEVYSYETTPALTPGEAMEGIRIKARYLGAFEIGTFYGSVGGVTRGIKFGTYLNRAVPDEFTSWADFATNGTFAVYAGVLSVFRYIEGTGGAQILLRKARGTQLAPTAALLNDQLGRIDAYGYGNTGFNATSAALLFNAAETFTDAASGTRMTLQTTPIGSLVAQTRLTMGDTGNVCLGNITSPTKRLIIQGNNDAGAENNTLTFWDTDTSIAVGQVLGKIEFYSADPSPASPGAGVKAWIAGISESATTANAAIVFATDTTTGAATERMRINSSGNVGIGTTAPANLLHVEKNTAATVNAVALFSNGAGDLGSGAAIYLTSNSSVSRSCYIAAINVETAGGNDHALAFATNDTGATPVERMRIKSTGVIQIEKLLGSTTEVVYTPSVSPQVIALNSGMHQTLLLTSMGGALTATLTIPDLPSNGSIIVKQHASTARNITWGVTSGTIKWLGTQPTWSSDAINAVRNVRWRWDGSIMYLESSAAG